MNWSEADYAAYLARQSGQPKRLPRPVLLTAYQSGPRYRSKTEARFAQEVLAPALHDGTLLAWQYEPIRLAITPTSTYTPDFLALEADGRLCTFYEIKGGWIRDRALDKLKQAAVRYHWWVFMLAQWKDGQWTYKRMPAA